MQYAYLYDVIIAHKASCNFLETSRSTSHVEISGLRVRSRRTFAVLVDIIISPSSRDLDFWMISNVLWATFAILHKNNINKNKRTF